MSLAWAMICNCDDCLNPTIVDSDGETCKIAVPPPEKGAQKVATHQAKLAIPTNRITKKTPNDVAKQRVATTRKTPNDVVKQRVATKLLAKPKVTVRRPMHGHRGEAYIRVGGVHWMGQSSRVDNYVENVRHIALLIQRGQVDSKEEAARTLREMSAK